MRSPWGWVTLLLVALAPVAAGDAAAQAYSCEKPIGPCTACHNPDLARDLARCLAEPWVAPASAKELKSPFPASPQVLKLGRTNYDIYCDGCHGPSGDGRGSIALKFSLSVINIGMPWVQAQTDGELFWKISNGKGAMPAWKAQLSEEDRWRLVAFVRTFEPPLWARPRGESGGTK
jgi:mono/diheme cytochrome c family protein